MKKNFFEVCKRKSGIIKNSFQDKTVFFRHIFSRNCPFNLQNHYLLILGAKMSPEKRTSG
jgi:hypothetical protein